VERGQGQIVFVAGWIEFIKLTYNTGHKHKELFGQHHQVVEGLGLLHKVVKDALGLFQKARGFDCGMAMGLVARGISTCQICVEESRRRGIKGRNGNRLMCVIIDSTVVYCD